MCRRLGEAGARTVAVVNDADSPLGGAADAVLALGVGPERAVPATKTVTGQMLAMAAVAAATGPVPFAGASWRHAGCGPRRARRPRAGHGLAARWAESARLFVAARGLLYAAALEAALKIKETTGILAEGISAADLRHGPIGVAGGDVPVLALDGGGAGREDVRAVAELARERGAPVAVCGDSPGAELPLPQGLPEALAVFPATVRAQQLAAAMAAARGIDPDTPAGLTKVTPTE